MKRRNFLRNIFGAAIATRLPLPKSLPGGPVSKPYDLLTNDLQAESGSMYAAMLKKYANVNYAMILEKIGRPLEPPTGKFKPFDDTSLIDQTKDI